MDDRVSAGPTPAIAAAPGAYPDYANPELLEKIPLAAKVVVDVGCATGALGAAYLRRNPAARMLGIDADPAAAAHAATRLSEVACLDVEATPMPFDVPDGVDCFVYGDVLEHLRDPWTLLRRHTELLRDGGTALICMPNLENWSFALKLLNGSFNYEDSGILDRTHLRWFTPRTMGEALLAAGLELADVAPRPTDLTNAQLFVQAIAPGLVALGIDPAEYLNRAGPLQFIWRARKTPPSRIFINATMLPPQGGVSDVRVLDPLRALRSDSTALTLISAEPDFAAGEVDMPKIAVLHRPLLVGDAGVQRVRTLLAKDYLVVTEFDDNPVFMAERGLDMSQLVSFTAVHAVQTSTQVLAEVLGAQNPEVAVFPNGIFELPPVRNFADPDRITLFFGALNRADDWAPYMAGLNDVARAVGARLRFVVAHDKDFFDALESSEKEFVPTCDYPTYLKLMGAAEIAFMPLGNTEFNRAKSDLKFIEAASCRVVSLASNVVYGASVENNKTGLVFTDSLEMRSHLLRVLAYPEAARRLGDAARAYVARERMLAYQVAARMEWYRSLWARRDELNAALRARVPALFE